MRVNGDEAPVVSCSGGLLIAACLTLGLALSGACCIISAFIRRAQCEKKRRYSARGRGLGTTTPFPIPEPQYFHPHISQNNPNHQERNDRMKEESDFHKESSSQHVLQLEKLPNELPDNSPRTHKPIKRTGWK